MNKRAVTGIMIMMMSLVMLLAPAAAETRESTIFLEGMEEPIKETLFESPEGFSLWYANEWLEADYGVTDQIEGVVISTIYSDDYMVLSVIPEEEAERYIQEFGGVIPEESSASPVQAELFRELKDGRYSFCMLITEEGKYMLAVGQYAEEAAEGNAKFFQRVLDSVVFHTGQTD